ncbi:hypothetical protein LXA43DRAFT_369146 [Ganoderma leucocontextum]|nr:hypothetical protein LXA43DRAFT_369146 [Ganoderma leucocontextum]
MHPDEPGYPCGQPQLNFDVLRRVCHHLVDVSDVLSFALTCSTLTEDALRRRLRMAPVNLLNGESIDNFYRFIFANEPARAPYIYGLKLPASYNYDIQVMDNSRFQTIDDHLVALLEAAIHIQYLYFPTSVSDPIFDAAMKLTTLRELHAVSDVYQGPLRFRLTTLRSPLRSLRIEENDPFGDNISTTHLHNGLSHFAPTLEVLELDFFQIEIPSSSVTIPFTAVRSLKVKNADFIFDLDQVAILLRLFPNLDNTLSLGTCLGTNVAEDEYLIMRQRNQEAQKAHAWSGLDWLVCDAETAFLMALQCSIRRMDIGVPHSRGKRYLTETLRHNSPRQLHLSLSFRDGFGVLDGLLPFEAADKLTHLVVFADFDVPYQRRARRRRKHIRVPWDQFIDRAVDSIKHLHITHLRIVFYYTVHQALPDPWPEGDAVSTECEVDLHSAATRLRDTMPTLQYLFLTACGGTYAIPPREEWEPCQKQTLDKWLSSKAWRVVHDNASGGLRPSTRTPESGSCIMELSREDAERVMHQEELRLSCDEEDMVRQCSDSTGD